MVLSEGTRRTEFNPFEYPPEMLLDFLKEPVSSYSSQRYVDIVRYGYTMQMPNSFTSTTLVSYPDTHDDIVDFVSFTPQDLPLWDALPWLGLLYVWVKCIGLFLMNI